MLTCLGLSSSSLVVVEMICEYMPILAMAPPAVFRLSCDPLHLLAHEKEGDTGPVDGELILLFLLSFPSTFAPQASCLLLSNGLAAANRELRS